MAAVEEAYELVDAIDLEDDEKILEETGDKFYLDLADICDKNNGIWSAEAEKYVLANAKKI